MREMPASVRRLVSIVGFSMLGLVFGEAEHVLVSKPDERATAMAFNGHSLPTGQTKWTMTHVLRHDSGVMSVAISPNGEEVAAGGILSPVINIWNVQTGTKIRQLQGLKGSAQALAYSPNGQFFAAGRGMVQADDVCVYVFQMGTDHIVQRLRPPQITTRRAPKGVGMVSSLQYSLDSRVLVVGFEGGAIGIYDALTGELKQALPIRAGLDGPVVYSPDGKYLAFGERKKDPSEPLDHYVIQLVDANTGDSVRTLLGHTDRVTSLIFHPDGKQLISGTNTGTVQSILDTKSNKAVTQRNEDPIRIWDIDTGALVKELAGHTGSVTALSFYDGGHYLVSGSQDHTIKVWDMDRKELVTTLTGHNALVDSMAVSADGRYLVSGGTELVKIWERL